MACGTPVITTEVTGVADLLDSSHASLITSANNPLMLADQMETLLTDSQAYQKAQCHLRNQVEDLDWSQVAKRMIDVYKKAIK
jgi:glycosyltransferase involved in cell wall biosynthesis